MFFFLKDDFMETFWLQYYLFSGYLLGHASWQTFLICYLSSIARVIIGHFVFCVSRFQSRIPHVFRKDFLVDSWSYSSWMYWSYFEFSFGLHDGYTCSYYF